ncbi:ABC transporter permease, partial [Variovorax sp. 2RAF20]
AELDAAIHQLRSYGLKQLVLAVAPDFAAGSLAAGTPWRRRLEQEPGLQALTLEAGKGSDSGAAASRIAAARPAAVIMAGDTLAYG